MIVTSFDGTALKVEISGPAEAPPLLLSNSLGTALGMWDAQMPALSASRIIRYDQRGHGGSQAPDGDYTTEMLGRDALAVLDAAGAPQAHVVGLSMGGMTGMWLAANRPGRVRRLVLSNTAAHLPPRDLWDGRIRTVRAQGMVAIVDAVVDRWFTKGFQNAHPEKIEPIRAMILATDPRGYAGCSAAIRDMDQLFAVRLIGAPTLVIAGRHDPATTVAQAEIIRDAIPGARLEILDAAHLSNIEAAAEYNRLVTEFLRA